MRKAIWAAAIALTAGLLAGGAPSAATAASPTDNGVHNTSTIAVGAVQTWITNACVYRQGCYDALIPAGRYSGWRYTAAVYFGDNYCLRVRAWQAGGGLGPVTITGEGPAYFVFNSVHPGFDVRAVPINHADCHSAAATSSGDAGEVVQAGQ